MQSNSYTIEREDQYIHVNIHEEKFTAKVAPELKAEMIALNAQDTKNIIFNMQSAKYCDSSGLSVILVANKVCEEKNGCLVVCGLQPNVQKLIEISQLGTVLNITPTFDEAVDYIFMDELEKGLSDDDESAN